jgi:hypothetical protein
MNVRKIKRCLQKYLRSQKWKYQKEAYIMKAVLWKTKMLIFFSWDWKIGCPFVLTGLRLLKPKRINTSD